MQLPPPGAQPVWTIRTWEAPDMWPQEWAHLPPLRTHICQIHREDSPSTTQLNIERGCNWSEIPAIEIWELVVLSWWRTSKGCIQERMASFPSGHGLMSGGTLEDVLLMMSDMEVEVKHSYCREQSRWIWSLTTWWEILGYIASLLPCKLLTVKTTLLQLSKCSQNTRTARGMSLALSWNLFLRTVNLN